MPFEQMLLYWLSALICVLLLYVPNFYIISYIKEFDARFFTTLSIKPIITGWACAVGIYISVVCLFIVILVEAINYTVPPKNNLIILDTHGILNNKVCIDNLNQITENNPNTSIVICSDWRIGRTLEHIKTISKEIGIKAPIISITPTFNHDRSRDDEITAWLQSTTTTWDSILIIDTNRSKRFESIQVRPDLKNAGLLGSHVDRAVAILNIGLPTNFDIERLEPTCKSKIKREMNFGGQKLQKIQLTE